MSKGVSNIKIISSSGGYTLIQFMVGIALTAIALSMAMGVLDQSQKMEFWAQANTDFAEAITDLNISLKNEATCKASLGGKFLDLKNPAAVPLPIISSASGQEIFKVGKIISGIEIASQTITPIFEVREGLVLGEVNIQGHTSWKRQAVDLSGRLLVALNMDNTQKVESCRTASEGPNSLSQLDVLVCGLGDGFSSQNCGTETSRQWFNGTADSAECPVGWSVSLDEPCGSEFIVDSAPVTTTVTYQGGEVITGGPDEVFEEYSNGQCSCTNADAVDGTVCKIQCEQVTAIK